MLKTLTFLGLALWGANADLYMQACRGSNNRLDEQGRDRNNGNRLFDSQNNDRGGYNVGKLTYYAGEKVPISWTNQHSSGLYQLKGTELIIQYSCGSLMRDGTTTNTIPDEPNRCYNYDCDTDVEYGRHESFTYYQYCKAQSRNRGLFTANQNMNNRDAAINTRQNPAGTRRGLECPEERDYYPYWRASPWRDIHIFTNQPARCNAYKKESQNVKSRKQCTFHEHYWKYVLKGYYDRRRGWLPLNETTCTTNQPEFVSPMDNQTYKVWDLETIPSHGVDEPGCSMAETTRTNHHGLIGGRSYWTYMWEVPDLSSDKHYDKADYETCCVVRMRYNITTDDYPAWESDDSINAGADWRNNSQENNPNADVDPAWIKIWERFGLTYNDIKDSFLVRNRDSDEQKLSRGYVFVNNPRVDPFGHTFTYTGGETRLQLQLAINTNQFGRTFQDRTHCFQVKDRPNDINGNEDIYLMTVQGKRGNIVQVYPATEYYFIPEPLTVSRGSYVHFCWTGSNTNPNNNDGQGDAGTDRSNICPLTQAQYNKQWYSDIDNNEYERRGGAVGDLGNNYPDWVQRPDYKKDLPEYIEFMNKRDLSSPGMAGFDDATLRALCTTRRSDRKNEKNGDDLQMMDYGNMEELDDAGTTFCIEPVQAKSTGQWNFLCTRNNNFSNRSQKGTLRVIDGGRVAASMDSRGGRITGGKGQAIVVIHAGMVEEGDTLQFEVTTWNRPGKDSTIVEISGVDGGEFSKETLVDGAWLELWIPYSPASMHTPVVNRKANEDAEWKEHDQGRIDYAQETQYAVVNIKDGGYYKSVNKISFGWLVAGTIIAAATVGGGAYVYKKKCAATK